jgi:hypothetical protein
MDSSSKRVRSCGCGRLRQGSQRSSSLACLERVVKQRMEVQGQEDNKWGWTYCGGMGEVGQRLSCQGFEQAQPACHSASNLALQPSHLQCATLKHLQVQAPAVRQLLQQLHLRCQALCGVDLQHTIQVFMMTQCAKHKNTKTGFPAPVALPHTGRPCRHVGASASWTA